MPGASEQSRDSAAAIYKDEPGRAYHEGKRALNEQALNWVAQSRARKFQEHVKPHHTVVEYGVGAGWNLAALKCARRIGFDISAFLEVKVKALGIEFVNKVSDLGDGLADVLICHHVLEHLDSPSAALDEFRRILKPGGKLILHVPWDREWRHSKFLAEEPNHHLYTWNAQSLGNLLIVHGFELKSIRVKRYGYDRASANFAVKFGLGSFAYKLVRKVIIFLFPLYEVEAVCLR